MITTLALLTIPVAYKVRKKLDKVFPDNVRTIQEKQTWEETFDVLYLSGESENYVIFEDIDSKMFRIFSKETMGSYFPDAEGTTLDEIKEFAKNECPVPENIKSKAKFKFAIYLKGPWGEFGIIAFPVIDKDVSKHFNRTPKEISEMMLKNKPHAYIDETFYRWVDTESLNLRYIRVTKGVTLSGQRLNTNRVPDDKEPDKFRLLHPDFETKERDEFLAYVEQPEYETLRERQNNLREKTPVRKVYSKNENLIFWLAIISGFTLVTAGFLTMLLARYMPSIFLLVSVAVLWFPNIHNNIRNGLIKFLKASLSVLERKDIERND